MKTATMTSKGQITIPLEIRNKLGLDKGDKVDFVDLGNNQFAIIPATEDVTKLKGLVKKPRSPVTIEEMNATIAKRASGR
ncbi:MAG: AbrB/MazE/SpoVT family DNA-binding domain-containing protein [Nitrospirae bacterium]|nr:AbrB/MazE/SpoVT family DNA-binding domain-containing protein [Nitrospirota bacterium]